MCTCLLFWRVIISYEEAEIIKTDKKRNQEVLPIVRPVIEKVSSIVAAYLAEFKDLEKVCLVGGTCELEGFTDVVGHNIGIKTFRPVLPQFITPLGVALSCLDADGISARS